MMNKGAVYICTSGHVEMMPDHGMFLSCQALLQVTSRNGGVGSAPCGAGIVSVPDPDGALEAAYRVGGTAAVLSILAERAREGASSAPAGH